MREDDLRILIGKMYDNPHWQWRVAGMPYNQLLAIYHKSYNKRMEDIKKGKAKDDSAVQLCMFDGDRYE